MSLLLNAVVILFLGFQWGEWIKRSWHASPDFEARPLSREDGRARFLSRPKSAKNVTPDLPSLLHSPLSLNRTFVHKQHPRELNG
jgi:hypothetical protein